MKKKRDMAGKLISNAVTRSTEKYKGTIQSSEQIMLGKIDEDICNLRNQLKQIKTNEIYRVMHEALFNHYEQKHSIPLTQLLVAMFGITTAKKELDKKRVRI